MTLFAQQDDFKLEICFELHTLRIMRYLASLLALIILAGCESTDKFYLVNGNGKIVGTGRIEGDNYF